MIQRFFDTSVFLLAVGGEHPCQEPCRDVLQRIGSGEIEAHFGVEGGQEFLFHRLRRTERDRAIAEFDQLARLVIWHDFDADILRASRDLVSAGHARGRDAVHAATALAAGFDAIVSCDADFDAIPGLRRLDPTQGPVV